MSFIFTADWHLKTKFKDVPSQWLHQRYDEWLEWLESQRKETKAQTLIIGGDIFDKVPTIYDLAMFVRLFYICDFSEYVIFPGNHEMLKKNKSFYQYLHSILIKYNVDWIYEKTFQFVDHNMSEWLIVPYPLIKSATAETFKGYNKVISHVRCASDQGFYDAEIDFSIFDNLDKVLLGDIHERKCMENIVYPGSPYDTAFTRLPLKDKWILHVDGCHIKHIKRDKFMRLIKLEVQKEKYLEIKEKIKESKNFFDIEVLIDNMSELSGLEDVKKKLTVQSSGLIDGSEDEQMHDYLVNNVKVTNKEATNILTDFKELI